MKLAHLTDIHWPHVEMPPLHMLLNKRLVGLCNWHFKRRHQHTMAALNAVVADVHAQHVDHTVLTGDLTNLILPQEIQEVTQWLETHWTPQTATVIAGNHDAYVPHALPLGLRAWAGFMGTSPPLAGGGRGRGFLSDSENKYTPLSHATRDSSPAGGEQSIVFPFLRRIGNISLIGLNTGHATWPFRAVGWLGDTQLQALEQLLIDEGTAGQCRVVLIHHPPAHVPCVSRKRLLDGPQLQDVLQRQGFEALLYGHLHEFRHTQLETATGIGHCIGAPSASDTHYTPTKGAGYALLTITQNEGAWDVGVEHRRILCHPRA